MTGFEIGAVIAVIFLSVGIGAGVLLVVALPQIRFYRYARRYLDDHMREELPAHEDDEHSPRWPGNGPGINGTRRD
jgi:hypothetical protein